MSDDGPEWFTPKRYGYGSGPPISWQGWAITIGFVAIVTGISLRLKDKPLQLVAILVPLTFLFCLIAARTTRGGWRWRWGDED
jgi:hypothetical protein